MRFAFTALLAICLSLQALQAAPKYFLTAQRIRRLKRDRERQTPRWSNFETRVNTVPNAPERGLELALYAVITGDEARSREALAWADTHRCQAPRQAILIQNWLAAMPQSQPPCPANPPANPSAIPALRDKLLSNLAAGADPDSAATAFVIKTLQSGAFTDGASLYAAVEYLTLLQNATHEDAREQATSFFASLPTLLLLSLKPDAIEHPDWQMHIAALALVSLDPNSGGAQFLQGWTIEDRQMLHDGPGMIYELLWADPYLPGVGYQNLDPWTFNDETNTLIARADWSPQACWIKLGPKISDSLNCPKGWTSQTTHFGHLNLQPFSGKCADVSHAQNQATIFTALSPGQRLSYSDGGGKLQYFAAGAAGLARVPVNVQGKVCLAR